jgi:mannose-6-phosphate isomerase
LKLYPLKFYEICKPKIWGGRTIGTVLQKALPEDEIGESWEVSDHFDDVSVVRNGPLEGRALRDIWQRDPRRVLGRRLSERGYREFPLLVKFIDAREILSVQVHPDQAYAEKYDESGESGKNEAWYIVEAEPGAGLVAGVKGGTTPDEFQRLLEGGHIERCLNQVEVGSGDLVYVAAGTVHAIGAGILICEIQQTSDATYRVWDWGRVDHDGRPRPLHLEHALNVIDFKRGPVGKVPAEVVSTGEVGRRVLQKCEFFVIEEYESAIGFELAPCEDSFHIVVFTGGRGSIVCEGERYPCRTGDTVLFPASLGPARVEPVERTTLLRTWIPAGK